MKDLIQYPIDGILDLHVFHPRDVVEVTKEYLRVCHERGIYRVRIIHGKGRSVLRRRIHKLLAVHPLVCSWQNAPDSSGWGAVVVALKAAPICAPVHGD